MPRMIAAHPPATATGIGAKVHSPAYTRPLSTIDQPPTRLTWRIAALGATATREVEQPMSAEAVRLSRIEGGSAEDIVSTSQGPLRLTLDTAGADAQSGDLRHVNAVLAYEGDGESLAYRVAWS